MEAAPLHYEMVRTRHLTFEVATAGQGPKLALLLHGFPECAHAFRYQIGLLAQLGYRVWAPNLRGYGRSDQPTGRRAYSMDQLEQDVTDLIDQSGAESVLLMGHDWGGAIAWSYVMHGERPIDKLVILNSPHPALFKRGLLKADQLRRSWYMFLFQLPWLPERMLRAANYRAIERGMRGWAVHRERFTDQDIDVLRTNAARPGGLTAMLNYYRALPWSIKLQERRGLRSVSVPTLVIWGEQDRALGRQLVEGVERYVDDCTVELIPDASHWVQQDSPERVNQVLEAWLTRPFAERPERVSGARV
jgi:pimeloyl-ACP methyl ester carboxylesterase